MWAFEILVDQIAARCPAVQPAVPVDHHFTSCLFGEAHGTDQDAQVSAKAIVALHKDILCIHEDYGGIAVSDGGRRLMALWHLTVHNAAGDSLVVATESHLIDKPGHGLRRGPRVSGSPVAQADSQPI